MDSPEDQVKQLLTAVGAMAEALSAFYHECIKNDFAPGQALELSKVLLANTLKGGSSAE